jgi:2-oxoglutarate ferredoxin oxidoreductase subunit gamma
MTKLELMLAGFGGQGILFAGKLVAYAGLIEDKHVSWLPSYGPEMRGGTCNCSVCVSDEQIGSPQMLTPNALIAMNQPSLEKFIGHVQPGGIVLVDSSIIPTKVDRTDLKVFYVPATEIAEKNGLKGMANILLTGKLLKETGFASVENAKAAVSKVVPPKKANLIDSNLKALQLGLDY